MNQKNYDLIYRQAFQKLSLKLKDREEVVDVLIKGSLNSSAKKLPYWSDLDVSVIVKDMSFDLFSFFSKIYAWFRKNYPEIKLSLTPINFFDSPKHNCLHHHGIKPLAFNFELASKNPHLFYDDMFFPSKDAVVVSSVYRYYEILYEFRKDTIQNNLPNIIFVSKYFHRCSRMIRTYMEIISPEKIFEEGMIDEEKNKEFSDFFRRKNFVKNHWLDIILDEKELLNHQEFLINFIEDINTKFLPSIIDVSKRFEK